MSEPLTKEQSQLDMSQVIRAEVPGTGKSMDELRREEAETLSPAELEKKLLEDKLLDASQQRRPEDVAANLWTVYWPVYKDCVKKMSNRQLRRLLTNLVGIGLENNPY